MLVREANYSPSMGFKELNLWYIETDLSLLKSGNCIGGESDYMLWSDCKIALLQNCNTIRISKKIFTYSALPASLGFEYFAVFPKFAGHARQVQQVSRYLQSRDLTLLPHSQNFGGNSKWQDVDKRVSQGHGRLIPWMADFSRALFIQSVGRK